MASASTVLKKFYDFSKKVLPLAEWEDALGKRLFKLFHRGFSVTIEYIPPASSLVLITDLYSGQKFNVEFNIDVYNNKVFMKIIDEVNHTDNAIDITVLHPPIYKTDVITTIDFNPKELNWFTFDLASLIINNVPLPVEMGLPRIELEHDLAVEPPPMVLGHFANSSN